MNHDIIKPSKEKEIKENMLLSLIEVLKLAMIVIVIIEIGSIILDFFDKI